MERVLWRVCARSHRTSPDSAAGHTVIERKRKDLGNFPTPEFGYCHSRHFSSWLATCISLWIPDKITRLSDSLKQYWVVPTTRKQNKVTNRRQVWEKSQNIPQGDDAWRSCELSWSWELWLQSKGRNEHSKMEGLRTSLRCGLTLAERYPFFWVEDVTPWSRPCQLARLTAWSTQSGNSRSVKIEGKAPVANTLRNQSVEGRLVSKDFNVLSNRYQGFNNITRHSSVLGYRILLVLHKTVYVLCVYVGVCKGPEGFCCCFGFK